MLDFFKNMFLKKPKEIETCNTEIGILDINLVALIFGNMTFFARVVYTLVGICGLINIGILLGHIDFKLD